MSRYTSKHTGPVIDAAIDRAKTGGAIDTTLQNKAPAGYGGFGETLPYIAAGNDDADGSKFDALIEAKFATLSNNTTLQLRFDCYPYISGSLFFGTLWKSSNNYGVLTGWSYDGSIIRKVKTGGAWLPFEWVNPPLTIGKEYRTTERYQGKPVYVREIDCGNMPSAGGVKTVQAPFDEADNPIDYAWIVHSHVTYYGQSLPSILYGATPTIRAAASVNRTGLISIIASSSTDWTDSNAKVYVTLKYIKNTD